jgi:hypothetical protein
MRQTMARPENTLYQTGLMEHLNRCRNSVLNASKITLYNQHFVNVAIAPHGVTIQDNLKCAHKQLFALFLKKTWVTDDLQKIIGLCAMISIINQVENNVEERDMHFIHILLRRLWYAAFVRGSTQAESPRATDIVIKNMLRFNVAGIEKIQTIDDPVLHMKKLHKQNTFHSRNTGLISYQQEDILYHANIQSPYHTHSDTMNKNNTTIHNLDFIVDIHPVGNMDNVSLNKFTLNDHA